MKKLLIGATMLLMLTTLTACNSDDNDDEVEPFGEAIEGGPAEIVESDNPRDLGITLEAFETLEVGMSRYEVHSIIGIDTEPIIEEEEDYTDILIWEGDDLTITAIIHYGLLQDAYYTE